MGLGILDKISKLKFNSEKEKELNDHLLRFRLSKIKGDEKIKLSSKEMGVRFYYNKEDIKKGLKEGYAVCIDCFNRYFLFLCKEKNEIYLLKIRFDLNEIFGEDATNTMDVREEEIKGDTVSILEVEEIIDNYLGWISEKEELKKKNIELIKSNVELGNETLEWLDK